MFKGEKRYVFLFCFIFRSLVTRNKQLVNLMFLGSIWHHKQDFTVNINSKFINFPGNSLLLIPNVEKLSLSENFLTNIEDLSGLSKLSHLYLSANRIRNVDNLHQCLSSTIVHLDLSQNQICSLRGFSCLTGLQGLDLGSNIVADVTEVCHVQSLEKLTYLVLTGNPVATVVDYRIKVTF